MILITICIVMLAILIALPSILITGIMRMTIFIAGVIVVVRLALFVAVPVYFPFMLTGLVEAIACISTILVVRLPVLLVVITVLGQGGG